MITKTSILDMGVATSVSGTERQQTISANIIDNSVVATPNETTLLLDGLRGAYVDASFCDMRVRDGSFNNNALKLGASDYGLMSAEYLPDMITYQRQSITNIYHGSWIFRRIIDKPAQDMWSAGITVNGDTDPEHLKRVYKRLGKLRSELIWVTGQARLYGGAASLIMVDDGSDDLTKPLNLRNIKKGTPVQLWSTDRWWGMSTSSELVTNYRSKDFNTPKYYTFYIDGAGSGTSTSSITVHHSRVLRFVNRRSARIINTRLNGWGISELEHIFQDLMIHENAKNSSGSLIQKALLEVIYVDGLRGIMQGLSGGNTISRALLSGQLSAIQSFRQNDLVLIDKGSEYRQFQTQFSGLSDLLETQKDIIAGAAEMPKVLLYGDTKGGLTSDSPAEMEFYAGTIKGKQEDMLRPIMDKLLPILFAVEGVPIPGDLDYDFENIAGVSQQNKLSLLQGIIGAVTNLVDGGFITHATGLKEIQQIQKITGFGSNISDEDFKLAQQSDTPENTESDGELTEETLPMPTNDYDDIKDEMLGKKTLFDKFKRKKKNDN